MIFSVRTRFRQVAWRADLIGLVDGLPADLSARKKRYLKGMGYGQNLECRVSR
jgi:hypothetical protein